MIHIARDGAQLGQFSLEQVNAMLASGQLKPTDLSWKEGLSTWVTLSELDGTQTASAAAIQPASYPAAAASPASASASVYAPPRASIAPSGYGGQVSAGAVLALRQTRPWVLFLAILGIIAVGLMALGIVGMLLMVGIGGSLPASSPGMGTGGSAGFFMGMAAFYAVMIFCYIYPVIKLFKYSGAISRLTRSNAVGDLEDALRQQKSFWKFVGIMMIVMIVVYIGFFILLGVGGIAAWSGMSGAGGFPSPPVTVPPVTVPTSP